MQQIAVETATLTTFLVISDQFVPKRSRWEEERMMTVAVEYSFTLIACPG